MLFPWLTWALLPTERSRGLPVVPLTSQSRGLWVQPCVFLGSDGRDLLVKRPLCGQMLLAHRRLWASKGRCCYVCNGQVSRLNGEAPTVLICSLCPFLGV